MDTMIQKVTSELYKDFKAVPPLLKKYKAISSLRKCVSLVDKVEWVDYLENTIGSLSFSLAQKYDDYGLIDEIAKQADAIIEHFSDTVHRFPDELYDAEYEYFRIILLERSLGCNEISSELLTILLNKAFPCSRDIIYTESK